MIIVQTLQITIMFETLHVIAFKNIHRLYWLPLSIYLLGLGIWSGLVRVISNISVHSYSEAQPLLSLRIGLRACYRVRSRNICMDSLGGFYTGITTRRALQRVALTGRISTSDFLRTFFLNITRLFLPFVASVFAAAWHLYLDGFSRELLRTLLANWPPPPFWGALPLLGLDAAFVSSEHFPPFSCWSPHELHSTSPSAPFRHIVVSVVLHVSHIGFIPKEVSPVFLHSDCWKGLNMVARLRRRCGSENRGLPLDDRTSREVAPLFHSSRTRVNTVNMSGNIIQTVNANARNSGQKQMQLWALERKWRHNRITSFYNRASPELFDIPRCIIYHRICCPRYCLIALQGSLWGLFHRTCKFRQQSHLVLQLFHWKMSWLLQ